VTVLASVAWPAARLPEAIEALARRCSFPLRAAAGTVTAPPASAQSERWIESVAAWLGVEAEPFLVTPNQREAEGLVGQEFRDDEDYLMAVERIADMGARNVLITSETRSFGLFRAERKRVRLRAIAPQVEPVSGVGAGDVLLAAFLAARTADRSLEDSLRAAVAAGAASTLEVGAGRFEPRDAGRLQNGVDVRELEPVST